jgi:hypothetical protein
MSPSNKNTIFIMIYPYKFCEFLWELFELDEFKQFVDVQIWDISTIVTSKFSESVVSPRCSRNEVIVCVSKYDYIRRLFDLRRQSANANICVLNTITNTRIIEFLCNLLLTIFLKNKNIKVFDLFTGGVPIVYPKDHANVQASQKVSGFFSKLTRFISQASTFKGAVIVLRGFFLMKLSAIFPTVLTHRLVAGEQWLSQAKKDRRNGIRYVNAHSHDCSNHLLAQKHSISLESSGNKTAVFLSSANPMFNSDEILHGGDQLFTSEVWYPALVRFFDFLEPATGVKVEVAGHYKAAFPAIAPCFGNRSVYYRKTREMVRQSEFVITLTSTAISYAVLFKKPVIFIYSNQLKDGFEGMRDVNGLAEMLGTKPINIDDFPEDIHPYLKVDEAKYAAYEREVLTSDPLGRPNCQIILEDIMGVSAKPGLPVGNKMRDRIK